MKQANKINLNIYVAINGKKPFVDWLEGLKDKKARYRIKVRLDRLIMGNLGDDKYIGKGVWELRIPFGPGYRVYFGKEEEQVILLLCGGNKSTQKKDITKAQQYWADFLER